MTTWANKPSGGYTLLEILLAIGVIGILLGFTVPLIGGSFGPSPGEEAQEALSRSAAAARREALRDGEPRRLQILERGLSSELDAIPRATLPDGWTLQLRRLTETKFRRPGTNEIWEFSSAGICEPITFLMGDGLESVTITFDPLTALVVPDE